MKKQVKYISAGMLAGMLLCGGQMQAANTMSGMHVCVTDAIQKDNRPEVSKRLFRSNAVEKEIIRVQKLLKNEKLAWMFANCFPNTIDTTVHFRKGADGKPDTHKTTIFHELRSLSNCSAKSLANLLRNMEWFGIHFLPQRI